MRITDLLDYPSIKKLASALHQLEPGQHGAAIMVGAGFSRSAARHVSGEKKMPLWDSFTKKLVGELNPNKENLSFSDPLRIAEEYRAYFGQAALNDRIRSEIDNEAWKTGDLYKLLLELPWSEVMTTNWDTLLERAAEKIHGPYYTPVTKPTDLTWASSPRIVKLHGTIGVTEIYVSAQEDYRTYPEKFAPFVNFARQVFIEKELCLLGFSGDDPNFLHWAGWVRDNLANHARKIYLVGALNLTAARRKHLESINIAPIDLWRAVEHIDDSDMKHQMATELFLQAMLDEGKSKMEPHKWSPTNLRCTQVAQEDLMRRFNDHVYAAGLLKEQLKTLQQDRESYPGWLVCPPVLQWQIKSQLSDPMPSVGNIAALEPVDRSKLLYEISWRYQITFEYIEPWLADLLFEVVNADPVIGINKRQQMEIALTLLKNSRHREKDSSDGNASFEERNLRLSQFLEENAKNLPDCAAELVYHQALVARDALDYARVESLVETIVGEDPVWKIRQAALLMELGKFDDANKLISIAYGELRESHHRDRHSVPILSRMMWAHLLTQLPHGAISDQVPEELPVFVENQYRKWLCDPWVWIDNIREKVRDQQEKHRQNQYPIEPSFEQGCYRDNSRRRSFGNTESAYLLLDGVCRDAGLPFYSGTAVMSVNLLASAAEDLVSAGGVGVDLWDFTLALRAARSETSPSIKNLLTRIGVARASQSDVDEMVPRICQAIEFWRLKRSSGGASDQGFHALSALRVLMEGLARLTVRVAPNKAKDIFQLGISLGKQHDLQHFWLSDSLDSLLTNSLASIPKEVDFWTSPVLIDNS